jgi:four helix bundle protein
MIQSFRDLIVWQKSMDLACAVPAIAAQLPRSEAYGLADQLRRAVVSIPSNIAEGHGRRSRGEYRRCVAIANGSLRELETLLLLTARRGLAEPDAIGRALSLLSEVGRMLTVLHQSLSAARSKC